MAHDRLSVADTITWQAGLMGFDPNISALLILDGEGLLDDEGSVRLDAIRRHVRSRLHLASRNRQRIHEVPLGLGRPIWVDHPDFDLSEHVTSRRLETPTREALLQLASDLSYETLDLSRPLWRMTAIDGLPGNQVALLLTAHHAVVDGYGGLEWAMSHLATTPTPEDLPEAPPWAPSPPPTSTELLSGAVGHQAQYARWAAWRALHAARRPRRAIRRSQEVARSAAPHVTNTVETPDLPLNRPVGERRSVATLPLSLAELAPLRQASGATVNSIVLAAVGGGLRRLLDSRGELTPGLSAFVFCPISMRTEGNTDAGNHASIIRAEVPVSEQDALVRLEAVHAEMTAAKSSTAVDDVAFIEQLGDFMVPTMMRSMARAVSTPTSTHLAVTNLVGPREPLWFMGSRVEELIPITALPPGWVLSIPVVSYAGTLCVGIRYDTDALPDIDLFIAGIEAELDDLRAALL